MVEPHPSALFSDLQMNNLTKCCASLQEMFSGYNLSVAIEEKGQFFCQYLKEGIVENLPVIGGLPETLPTIDYTPAIKIIALTALAVFVGYKLLYRQNQNEVNN
jgi:hypothetical protein